MQNITLWHNPKCSKSREAMSILEEKECQVEVIKYLEVQPDISTIKEVLNKLELSSARNLMRTKEDIYKELNLKEENDEEKLIEAMATHHKLIERPIIIKGSKAIIGRPTSKIAEFLDA